LDRVLANIREQATGGCVLFTRRCHLKMDVKTMEKDLKFYNQDLDAMLQKSGVVKYGFVMAGNSGAMSEFQGNLKDLITVKWYPSNKYECIPANKVCFYT